MARHQSPGGTRRLLPETAAAVRLGGQAPCPVCGEVVPWGPILVDYAKGISLVGQQLYVPGMHRMGGMPATRWCGACKVGWAA